MEAMAVVHDEYLPWGDENYRRNPYPWYDRVRQERPVYKMADGTYVVTRYDDITKYGKLPIMAIVDPEWVPKGPWTALSKTVLGVDPPVHTNLRRRTNKWFTPKLVQTWVEAAEKLRTMRWIASSQVRQLKLISNSGLFRHTPPCAAPFNCRRTTSRQFIRRCWRRWPR